MLELCNINRATNTMDNRYGYVFFSLLYLNDLYALAFDPSDVNFDHLCECN